MTTFVYCFIMTGIVIASLACVWRFRNSHALFSALVIVGMSAALIAFQLARFFDAARLLAWGWFVFVPVTLLLGALLTRQVSSWVSGSAITLTIAIGAVAVYAIGIEPYWLDVNLVRIRSDKVSRPIRIVLIADLQTDKIADYERETLRQVLSLKPDSIVFAGDYLQVGEHDHWTELCGQLRDYLKEIDFDAPLGVYAVGGNTDRYRWPEIFQGLPVHCMTGTQSIENSEFQLTGLSVNDSFDTDLTLDSSDKFHIVLGHGPDFALGKVHADLLLAGHTHGGQVQVPMIGPLVTFSAVPRSWASGVTEIEPGRHLVVSRGVGMERGEAPRIRFLCRPELVVIDVLPADSAN